MGRFDGVLLASDFDNTLIYTEEALRTGKPVPPLSERNRAALERFMAGLPWPRAGLWQPSASTRPWCP